MFLAHPASGLTTAYVTRRLWDREEYSQKQRTLLYSGAIVSAYIPDFDIAYAALHGLENHRYYITHTPFLYILITLSLLLLSILLKSKSRIILRSFAFLFLTSTLTHIFTDMLGGTMRLLYPFSEQIFTFFKVNPILEIHNKIGRYLFTPIFGLSELFWIVSAFYILFRKINREEVIFRLLLLIMAISCIIVLASVSVIIMIV
ncbi:MAG: metal-dependent hydrolase [Candidatus Dojkabacteria bacterium]|nr:metal-dependent hydrolase [Candidatus Dojkabacteria bacterium]